MSALAAIDIGTNSVRLLVTDPAGRELERLMRMTRLGQGVDVTGQLSAAAIERTVSVLVEYASRMQAHGVTRVCAVATSAARDAQNGALFFEAAERALGVRPTLLSGDEEARWSFYGATDGLDRRDGPFLVIDLGGGSTEFVLGTEQPEAATSLQMGCVRMSERHLHGDPPTSAQVRACAEDVRRELVQVRSVMDVTKARTVVGLAGTVTALSALQLGLVRYDAARTHHSRLSAPQVAALATRLAGANVAERRELLVEPARAEVIAGGALVLATTMSELGLAELLVSERDILDGLAASLR
ncbi:MAG TPA: Ppx/GppA phosphatase family protein [Polyangiaceae bacterium]|nr:Ppx/GppA phosphatase family protein [Polyangiaceae bacterium]